MATEQQAQPLWVGLGKVGLPADLRLADEARGLVILPQGVGTSRDSPRVRQEALALQAAGLGTLALELITRAEEREQPARDRLRFDLDLFTLRLVGVIDWVGRNQVLGGLPLGLLAAANGAAGALAAAAYRPERVRAVVGLGGRPDLAGPALVRVLAPTLLIVGGADDLVLGLNRRVLDYLRGPARLAVIPGAGHLFEEPGTLEHASSLAAHWLAQHLLGPRPGAAPTAP